MCMFLMCEPVFIYPNGNVMLSQPQRRSIWGEGTTRPQTLRGVYPERSRGAQGDTEKLAHRVN